MTLVVLHGDARPVELGELTAFEQVRFATADGLAAAMPGADALLLWDFFSTAVKDVWEHADALRWIHVAAAGVDKLLFPALVDSEVVVTNSRGIFDRPIAEFVLASILGMAKDLPGSLRRQQATTWEHRETEQVEGARALIVGTGSIGRACARLLTAAGLTVTGVGRTARDRDPDFGIVHEAGRICEVVGDADYVVLIAPLTDATRGMIDAEVL
ncbi:MAG: NAD(P)-dependent oxidoreductase, partial [Microbacterium sp.]